MTNWIRVKDGLPKSDKEIVLTIRFNDINEYSHPYTAEEAMQISFYSSGKWWDEAWPEDVKEDNIIPNVTHWMPLPEPPEENKQHD